MKKVLSILLAVLLLAAMVGCSGPGTEKPGPAEPTPTPATEPQPEEPSGEDKDITIAVIPQQLGNVVFLPAKEGAEDAGKELGINVEWQAPVRADATLQVEIIEGLIERKVDGIAISCAHPDALKDTLERAVEAGIDVSTFEQVRIVRQIARFPPAFKEFHDLFSCIHIVHPHPIQDIE